MHVLQTFSRLNVSVETLCGKETSSVILRTSNLCIKGFQSSLQAVYLEEKISLPFIYIEEKKRVDFKCEQTMASWKIKEDDFTLLGRHVLIL